MITQKEITLPPFKRGMHLITGLIEKELGKLPETGMLNLFVKHTSAALTINENCDPEVRTDMDAFMDRLIPDNYPHFRHTQEGNDDMPSHIKTSIFSTSLNIPITNGKLNMGIWQGIYFCEFRDNGGRRRILVTIWE